MGLYLFCVIAREDHIKFLQANPDCVPSYLAGERARRKIKITETKKGWFRKYSVESENEIEIDVPEGWPSTEPEVFEFNCKGDFLHVLLSDGINDPSNVLSLFAVYDDWESNRNVMVLHRQDLDPVFAISSQQVVVLRDAISLIESSTVAERASRSNRGYDENDAQEEIQAFRTLIESASNKGGGILYSWG